MSYFVLLLGDEESVGGADSDNPLMMLFNEVHHFTDPTGRALSEPFLRLPSRRFGFFFFFRYNIQNFLNLITYIFVSISPLCKTNAK